MRIKKPLPLPFKIHEVSKSCSHRGSARSGCNSAWSSASDVEFFMRGSIAFQAMWWGLRENFQNLFLDVDTVKSCSPHRQDLPVGRQVPMLPSRIVFMLFAVPEKLLFQRIEM